MKKALRREPYNKVSFCRFIHLRGHDIQQTAQVFDDMVNPIAGWNRFAVKIEPAGGDPGVHSALNVGRERVPDDEHGSGIRLPQLAHHVLKEAYVRLGEAQIFGNKVVVEIRQEA